MVIERTKTKKIWVLLLIMVIALFFRFWRLESVPPGLYPDEAINANEAFESLKNGNFKLFYPENNGREGLFIWLISLSFSIFGASIWSLKLIPALFGTLTVLGLYLLAKELFSNIPTFKHSNSPTVIALLSSFFLAISFWHINFSRIGFRAILTPFALVFSFFFLCKGFREKNALNLLIAGIFFGFGFYTYISFRLAVLLLMIILPLFGFYYVKNGGFKKYLFLAFCFLISAFITALPIGIYFLQNPEDFIARAGPISIFGAKSPIVEFLKSLILHLGMFNFYGDNNWRHNLSGSPQLALPIGVLFLIGFAAALKELKNSIKEKNVSLFTVFCLLLSWFFIMLLPGALTREGLPHALRTIAVIPVVYILSGWGGMITFGWLSKKIKNKKLLAVVCFLFLVSCVLFQYNKYFIKWGQNPETKNAFSKNYVDIGNYLNSLPENIQKIVIVNNPGVPVPLPDGIPVSAQTIMFVENAKHGKTQSLYLLPEKINQIKINKNTVIVPMTHREELFKSLQNMFPEISVENKNNIITYEIIY